MLQIVSNLFCLDNILCIPYEYVMLTEPDGVFECMMPGEGFDSSSEWGWRN